MNKFKPTRMKVIVDGCVIEKEITTPLFDLGKVSLGRFAYDYAKRHGISAAGVRVVPILDTTSNNPYNKRKYNVK